VPWSVGWGGRPRAGREPVCGGSVAGVASCVGRVGFGEGEVVARFEKRDIGGIVWRLWWVALLLVTDDEVVEEGEGCCLAR
jgi:hypothetical protein